MSDGTSSAESAAIAEQSVIGSMLMAGNLGASTIENVAAILELGDFPGPRHRAICRAILALHGEGAPVDVVTVGDRLGERLGEHGGHAYLMELLQSVPHAAHATYYAGIVREHSERRREIAAANHLAAIAADPTSTPEQRQAAIEAITSEPVGTSKRGAVSLGELLPKLDPRNLPPLRLFPIGEGFELVELYPRKVVSLAAGPGGGKTALMLQWAFDSLLADKNLTAYIANVEMPPEDLAYRQLARLGGVPFGEIMRRSASLGRVWGDRIEHALAVLSELQSRLYFARNPHSLEAIAADVARIKPDIVVLDYLQKIRTNSQKGDAKERIDEVMIAARKMAFNGACVLAASAVSRQKTGTGSGYKNLTLASLRDSSDLEFSGDDVWLMEMDDPGADPREPIDITLTGGKVRNGIRPKLALSFDGKFQRFEAIDPHANLSVHAG